MKIVAQSHHKGEITAGQTAVKVENKAGDVDNDGELERSDLKEMFVWNTSVGLSTLCRCNREVCVSSNSRFANFTREKLSFSGLGIFARPKITVGELEMVQFNRLILGTHASIGNKLLVSKSHRGFTHQTATDFKVHNRNLPSTIAFT